MTTTPSIPTTPSDQEIVLTRVYDQPRDLVFQAWTQPEHLMRWWAPHGVTTPFCTVDLRPGGAFHFCMRTAEGRDVWALGIYQEIVVPEKIVYIDSFADAEGNPVPPSHYGMSDSHPAEALVTVTFAEHDGKTTVTLHHAISPTAEEYEGARQGWQEMLERLSGLLAKG